MLRPSQGPEGHDAWGTSRRSRLFRGLWLVHADLHNHTWLSDGAGDPGLAFACLRAAGLDVAAITDHSRWASAFLGVVGAPGWTGIDGRAWRRTATSTPKPTTYDNNPLSPSARAVHLLRVRRQQIHFGRFEADATNGQTQTQTAVTFGVTFAPKVVCTITENPSNPVFWEVISKTTTGFTIEIGKINLTAFGATVKYDFDYIALG